MLFFLACATPPPVDQVTTEAGHYRLSWSTTPTPLPLNTLFEVHTVVVDAKSGAPVEDATVTVDATMPQHGHGMTTKPEVDPGTCTGAVCRHPGGAYTSRGMKFHMPGAWTLHFQVDGPAGGDHADVVTNL